MTTQEEQALSSKFKGPRGIAWVLLIGSLLFLFSTVYPIIANEASPTNIGHEFVTVDTDYGEMEFVCLFRESYPRSGPDCVHLVDGKPQPED